MSRADRSAQKYQHYYAEFLKEGSEEEAEVAAMRLL